VIVERALMSLNDIIGIWILNDKAKKYKEYFTPEKLTYYFLKALSCI
jgi:hypothetical protein